MKILSPILNEIITKYNNLIKNHKLSTTSKLNNKNTLNTTNTHGNINESIFNTWFKKRWNYIRDK